ncbi:hypothetical protein WZ342_2279 [Enterococcus faecalis]|nr:hypothetical protein WZ342_2279 [Enterococcus faecalis]
MTYSFLATPCCNRFLLTLIVTIFIRNYNIFLSVLSFPLNSKAQRLNNTTT